MIIVSFVEHFNIDYEVEITVPTIYLYSLPLHLTYKRDLSVIPIIKCDERHNTLIMNERW